MAYQKFHTLCLGLFLLVQQILFAQVPKFQFDAIQKEWQDNGIPVALVNNSENLRLVHGDEAIHLKYTSKDWIHVQIAPNKIETLYKEGVLDDFYLEYAPGVELDDTVRTVQWIDSVHAGNTPLPAGYTGKNIIIGVVDSGLDHNHPDFLNPQGNKRLIRYWDHTITNPISSPQPYGYGQIWTQQDITSGAITSNETQSGHGTSVTGIATGNGLANGTNMGMAPEALIIAVKTNFSLPNWTLTIADACDYIFRVADTLGIPAVVNLSLGTYLGSRDAKDPAGMHIDQLLGEKNGRLVICAAGNAGNWPDWHVKNDITIDTSFVWIKNNPNSSFGTNKIYFDLWSDLSAATYQFALGANLPSGSYALRGRTNFYGATANLGSVIFDTIFNSNGQRLATVEVYREIIGTNYRMQVLFSNVDSTSYNFGLFTAGSGSYDLWTSTQIGLNEIVKNVPSISAYPPISNYAHPDNLQSIVSSWNCSERVVSVGNLRGRFSHIDKNGNMFAGSNMVSPGTISINSSRGPTRTGFVKPDIMAPGDVTLGAGPAWILNNPSFNSTIEQGGFHIRNGGTSMASPVVAGTAALYLEKCPHSNWNHFKQDILAVAFEDAQTGSVPNPHGGNGKFNSFDLLVASNKTIQIIGDTVLCQGAVNLSTIPQLMQYTWSTGENASIIGVNQPQDVFVSGRDQQGCVVFSDTISITEGEFPPAPIITVLDSSLISSAGPNIQWYLNDSPIAGANSQFFTPNQTGFYSVSFTNADGCTSFSTAQWFTLNLMEKAIALLDIFPNPTSAKVQLSSDKVIKSIQIVDSKGTSVFAAAIHEHSHQIDLSDLANGIYHLQITFENGIIHRKIVKN